MAIFYDLRISFTTRWLLGLLALVVFILYEPTEGLVGKPSNPVFPDGILIHFIVLKNKPSNS